MRFMNYVNGNFALMVHCVCSILICSVICFAFVALSFYAEFPLPASTAGGIIAFTLPMYPCVKDLNRRMRRDFYACDCERMLRIEDRCDS